MCKKIGTKQNCMIGLFGIPRSGKNYTIDDFLRIAEEHGCHFIHFSPMDEIRARLDGRRLRDMSLEERIDLVKEVRHELDILAKHANVIVDEHYCYPSEIGGAPMENGYYDEKLPHDIIDIDDIEYEVVMPRFAVNKYDLVALMDIPPETILQRMRTSQGVKQNLLISLDEIADWEYAEYALLLMEYGDEMAIIDDPIGSGEMLWDCFSDDEDDEDGDVSDKGGSDDDWTWFFEGTPDPSQTKSNNFNKVI